MFSNQDKMGVASCLADGVQKNAESEQCLEVSGCHEACLSCMISRSCMYGTIGLTSYLGDQKDLKDSLQSVSQFQKQTLLRAAE